MQRAQHSHTGNTREYTKHSGAQGRNETASHPTQIAVRNSGGRNGNKSGTQNSRHTQNVTQHSDSKASASRAERNVEQGEQPEREYQDEVTV